MQDWLKRRVSSSPILRTAAHRTLRLASIFSQFGISPILLVRSLARVPRFGIDYVRFRARVSEAEARIDIKSFYPILTDYSDSAGVASGHYFHQDLWAARRIFSARPSDHLDVGSRIDGFVAHVLCFMPVTVVDVRRLDTPVTGLRFVQGDATTMHLWADDSVVSLSSLHAVEHFGLGRYGDPIDPNGSFKAMRAFARVLQPGGRLYFSVPIGTERVEYNAHRVFSPQTILSFFDKHGLSLVEFACVDDRGAFIENADASAFENSRFSCGLFEFTK